MAKNVLDYSSGEYPKSGLCTIGIHLGRASLLGFVVGMFVGRYILVIAGLILIISILCAIVGVVLSRGRSICGWIVVGILGTLMGMVAWSTVNYRL